MSHTPSHTSADHSSEIVFGADVVMTKRGHEITFHTPNAQGRQVLGRYTSVADAWRALDELDAPLIESSRAA